MLLACVFLRRTIARMRGLNVDNRELELTSNCTIPELSGRRHYSSSGSDFSSSPASSTLPLPDFHQPHSHVNRSYTNTYSSCSSFKLPNIIGNHLALAFTEDTNCFCCIVCSIIVYHLLATQRRRQSGGNAQLVVCKLKS